MSPLLGSSAGAAPIESVDLVVAGAGGGLAAAVRAGQLGLRVLVIDASPQFANGNNTSMSTAMLPGAGTRWQESAGIEDSPAYFIGDIMRKTSDQADPLLARALATLSPRLVTWLADDLGLRIELAVDFAYPGHSRMRCHTIPRRKGAHLLAGLLDGVRSLPEVDMLVPARLVDAAEEAGRIVAAVVEYPDGGREQIPCKALLMATNGFGAVPGLVGRHIPEIAAARYHGSAESRGDALRIGTDHQAATAYLDAYQGHGAVATPHGTLVGWATIMHGAFLVNNKGQRFGDESSGYSEFAREVIAQPGSTAVLVLDQRIHDCCLVFDDFCQTVASGALRWADDASELAASFAIDPAALASCLDEVTECARHHKVDRFGRSSWEAPLQPPLAGVRVTGALFHTQGGLRVDGNARVLRADGTPIEGLYASGGAAMGISGHGAAGYLAGNGLLPALGLALLAAEHVAH